MKVPLSVTIALFFAFGLHLSAATPTQFDGRWERDWTKTTPQGVHVVGQVVVDIRTSGLSTLHSKLTLTQTISGVTKTLQIVKSCEATHTELKRDVLTIRWSAPKLISPKRSEIPPGLHLWESPVATTYTLRGQDMLATIDGESDVFHRVRPKT
jgi:hypothetical protein